MTNRIIKKISRQVHFYYHYLIQQKKIILSKAQKNIILLGLPTYNNIGDEAIAYAEHKFLHDKFPNANIIEITEEETVQVLKSIKAQLSDTDVVCLQGGGNLGTLYPYQEYIRETVIKTLTNTKIILFPQSIFFETGKEDEKREIERTYHENPSINLILREGYSYKIAQHFLSSKQLSLTPDIVLYLLKVIQSEAHLTQPKEKILCVLRDDFEKKISQSFVHSMEQLLKEKYKTVSYSDTMSKSTLINTNSFRKRVVTDKICEIEKNDVIITDRLHGMILSILAHRPCIVLQNGNPKIQSTVKTWLDSCPLVFFLEDTNISNLEIALNKIENLDVSSVEEWFVNLDLDKLYQPIEKIINGS